jgi:hypothetical protein
VAGARSHTQPTPQFLIAASACAAFDKRGGHSSVRIIADRVTELVDLERIVTHGLGELADDFEWGAMRRPFSIAYAKLNATPALSSSPRLSPVGGAARLRVTALVAPSRTPVKPRGIPHCAHIRPLRYSFSLLNSCVIVNDGRAVGTVS